MRLKRSSAGKLLSLIIIFELSAFALLALSKNPIDINAVIVGLMMVGLLLFQYFALTSFFRHIDRYILIIANILAGIGIIMQYRLNPDNAFKQIVWLGIGMLMMVLAIVTLRNPGFFKRFRWPIVFFSLAFLALPIFIGRTVGGAKNWIAIGGQTLQPSEFIKIALLLILAGWLGEKIRLFEIWPALGFVSLALLILMFERDLGAAVLYFGTTVVLYFVATGNKLNTLLGLGAGAGAAVASYFLFSHVRVRVAVWRNPWATYTTQGYQVAQGLMAIASGGLWGVGLGLGSPKTIPAYSTDYIFAVICEEFGIIIGLCVVAFYLVFIIRGAMIALNAPDRYSMLLAFGCTVLITLQSFIIIGGVIKLIPLTGITMPFVSYGGSSILTSMMLLGVLESVAISGGEALEKQAKELNV